MIESVLKNPIVLLSLSVGLLALGPILHLLWGRVRWALSMLDGFVLVGVGGFVLLHVIPEAVETAGIWGILIAILGVIAPLLLGRLQRMTEEQAHHYAMWLALLGVGVHALLDGIALSVSGSSSSGHHHGSEALIAAVLLHRLPVGLMIWIWGRTLLGTKRTVMTLIAIGIATLSGFFLGGQMPVIPGGFGYALFQALVAGALLHVLLHRHEDDEEDTCGDSKSKWKWAEVGGALIGVAMLSTFPEMLSGGHAGHAAHAGHTHAATQAAGHVMSYAHSFLHLCLESAPALLLGYLIAGALSSFLPQASLQWLHRGSPFQQASKGMLFGLPLPICSCGVVPVYQSLIQRGVPATAAMAFLVATPELGIESIILSFPLLGVKLTIFRLLSAAVVALLVGWLVGRTLLGETRESQEAVEATDGETPSLVERIRQTFTVGLGEIVGDTAAWILVGIAIAAALQPSAVQPLLKMLPPGTDVLLFAVLGIPFYVCASGATPLAAALVFSGVSPGAAIAFLLAGPATNVTTFGVLSKLHNFRAALMFGLMMMGGAIGMGYLTNLSLGTYTVPLTKTMHQHQSSLLQWICLSILGVAFFVAILRKGPIAFIWSIFSFGREGHSHGEQHDHSHDHDHDHDHGSAHDEEDIESTSETPAKSCCSHKIK